MFLAHVCMDNGRHFGIERRNDLVGTFRQRHERSAFMQVFSHLDTDKATADDQGAASSRPDAA